VIKHTYKKGERMSMRFIRILLFLMLAHHAAFAGLNFYDNTSVLNVDPMDGKLIFRSNPVSNELNGKVVIQNPVTLSGDVPLYFNGGVLTDDDFDVTLSATYDPNSTYSIILGGNGQFYVTNPGKILQRILVQGTNNRLEGQPIFKIADAVKLADSSTQLTIAIQSELNQNVVLSGGTVLLDDNLGLGDNVLLTGSGTIDFRGFNLSTGQKDLIWTDTLRLLGAKNLSLGANSRLYANWIIDGDAHIVGNNNILDLTAGGTLIIQPNTSLRMTNLYVKGLGSGLSFPAGSSELRLNNVTLELDNDYTLTNGSIYVEGPVKVITKNHFMTFDQAGTLTVDGATLEYDTLDYNDENNVRFGPTGFEQLPRYVTYMNGGSVRKMDSLKVGPFKVSTNRKLDRDFTISPLRPMVVDADPVVDGDGFVCEFALSPQQALVNIDDNQLVQYKNIFLRNFPMGEPGLSIGTGATLILGPQTTVEVGESSTLAETLYFEGNAVLNGKGKVLELAPSASLILRPGASLLIDNITLRGVSGSQIICMDNSCTMSIGDVVWEQDDDFSFTNGSIYVKGLWDIKGTSTFGFRTSRPLDVSRFGTIYLDEGMTFSYSPPVDNRDLVRFENDRAKLILNNATLMSTTTGLRLTKGTMIVDGYSYCQNPGALYLCEGVSIGNGTPADEVTMIISPGATFDILSGILFYDQEE
jgi:hypothetical protein